MTDTERPEWQHALHAEVRDQIRPEEQDPLTRAVMRVALHRFRDGTLGPMVQHVLHEIRTGTFPARELEPEAWLAGLDDEGIGK